MCGNSRRPPRVEEREGSQGVRRRGRRAFFRARLPGEEFRHLNMPLLHALVRHHGDRPDEVETESDIQRRAPLVSRKAERLDRLVRESVLLYCVAVALPRRLGFRLRERRPRFRVVLRREQVPEDLCDGYLDALFVARAEPAHFDCPDRAARVPSREPFLGILPVQFAVLMRLVLGGGPVEDLLAVEVHAAHGAPDPVAVEARVHSDLPLDRRRRFDEEAPAVGAGDAPAALFFPYFGDYEVFELRIVRKRGAHAVHTFRSAAWHGGRFDETPRPVQMMLPARDARRITAPPAFGWFGGIPTFSVKSSDVKPPSFILSWRIAA